MLEKKVDEHTGKTGEWMRKAEMAVDKGQDDLARAALERHKSAERTTSSFNQQVEDQRTQVATLKSALAKLETKLGEAQSKSDMLMAQHRRARALGNASDAVPAYASTGQNRTPAQQISVSFKRKVDCRVEQRMARANECGQWLPLRREN